MCEPPERQRPRFLDLLQQIDWESVWSTRIFSDYYGEGESERARYSAIYSDLRALAPQPTELAILVTHKTDELTGESGIDVSGFARGDDEGSAELVSLVLVDWSEWISMPVAAKSLREFTVPEIIAHCLWEMTFFGWWREEHIARVEHVQRSLVLTRRSDMKYHAFLCHASEDKAIAREICRYLEDEGYKIWFDELDLALGDSLRSAIDKGLAVARYGVVILSPSFFRKHWTAYELDGLVAKQMEGRKVLLPVWHQVSQSDVLKYSPSLAALKAISTEEHPSKIAFRIIEVLDPPRILKADTEGDNG